MSKEKLFSGEKISLYMRVIVAEVIAEINYIGEKLEISQETCAFILEKVDEKFKEKKK